MTIEDLQRFGARTDEGLARCLNNEQFYLMLVKKAIADDGYTRLQAAVEQGDFAQGFEIAHGLKGVLGNLSLTPLYEAVCEITELLRANTQTDYTPYLHRIAALHRQLADL
ncbi:MAG: Hpt domain-containing protein [Ruminococcus sp.]|nr:Hpt domain-containing protein [Ruminococcus sp.]